jgi:SAM-dependent methyltransferase
LFRRQREDAARRIDPATGLMHEHLSVPCRCCVCGSEAFAEQFVKDGFRFGVCADCGLWYVNPRLCQEEAARLYQEGGRGHFQFDHFYLPSAKYRQQELYPRRLAAIEARLGRVGRLLDVGSSTGHFLECAQNRGWQTHGVELAEYAARYARDELGLDNVRSIDLLRTDARTFEGAFDAVTLWDVIEHVTSPRPLLEKVRELLVPGGMVFMHTPHADCFERDVLGAGMWNFAGDFHPVCYTQGSLRRLVEECGLVIEDLFTFGLDLAHLADEYEQRGCLQVVEFLHTHGDQLQGMIDAQGRGCYLACYARRPEQLKNEEV